MPPIDPASVSLHDLDLSVRSFTVLENRGVATVADLLTLEDPSSLPRRVRAELRALVAEAYGMSWPPGEDGQDEPAYAPPADRAVPRQAIVLAPTATAGASALVSRIGGLPCAPSTDQPWPMASERPMQFILQLVGVAAGGSIELGDVTVIQVFADLEGAFYEASAQAVVVHREPCPAVLAPPPGVAVAPAREMSLVAGADDRILLDVDDPEDDDALAAAGGDRDVHDEAASHAWCNKLRGIPVGANLERDQRDSRGQAMDCLLQLVDYDEWFLWYLFVSRDLREARLQVVRG